jgi:hypothetical protein
MNPENPKGSKLASAAVVGIVGVTLYWTFTYSGPYRYLAELQIKSFGYYVPKLTALVIILGLLLIAGVIKLILRGAERPVPGPTATMVPNAKSAPVLLPWFQYARYVAPVIVVGFGGWCYFNGTQAGSLQQLNAADFQKGNVHSRIVYADVRGHLSGMYLGQEHYLYIPMYAEGNGSSPAQLVVGVDENQMRKYVHREADGTFTVRGIADRGLAGDVKYAFEKNGVTVADHVWVVHAGRAPGDDRRIGIILTAIGIVVAGLIFGIDTYKKRRNATARPLQVPT